MTRPRDVKSRSATGCVKFEATSNLLPSRGFRHPCTDQSLSDVNPYMLKCMSKVSAIALLQEYWQTLSCQFLEYAKQTQQLMYIVRNHGIAKRLWLLLTWLANKFGRRIQQGKLIDFKITHQELAEAIGTTRITVTKILNQFEKESLILRPKTKCIVVLM